MRRALAILGGVIFGLASWFALIWVFHYTWKLKQPPLIGELAFWLSHWTFVGWAFGALLIYVWYRVLMRVTRPRPPRAPDINGDQPHAT